MKRIGELVTISYHIIDSILVTESDYLKLNELGYINENLGSFSVQNVFTRFAIKDCRKWIGICKDGIVECRPKKLNITFDEFVNTL